VACLAVGSACEDAASDPLSGLGGDGSQAGLLLGVSLPDPVAWVGEDGLSVEESVALESWHDSWKMEPGRGEAARESAYPVLSESLARRRETDSLAAEIDRLTGAVTRALVVGGRTLPVPLAGGLRAAYDGLSSAAAAQSGDDDRAAAEHLLRASDALRLISPEAVARALVAEVEDRFGRISADNPYTEQDLERADRLVRGGRQALDARDWVLAIRRAYYARALLEGSG
jgi:hypothetical protein